MITMYKNDVRVTISPKLHRTKEAIEQGLRVPKSTAQQVRKFEPAKMNLLSHDIRLSLSTIEIFRKVGLVAEVGLSVVAEQKQDSDHRQAAVRSQVIDCDMLQATGSVIQCRTNPLL